MSNRYKRQGITWFDVWSAIKRFAIRAVRPCVRGLIICGILFVAALGCIKAYEMIRQLPHFDLTEIELNPIAHLTRDQILEACGLDQTVNIFEFDKASATKNILEFPWVAEVEIKTDLPNRVSIHVTEREAAGILVLGELFLIDKNGHPFAQAKKKLTNLPLITGLDPETFDPETFKPKDPYTAERIVQGLSIAQMYTQSPFAKTWPLSDVCLAEGERYELHLGETRVALGKKNLPEKLERTYAILDHLARHKLDANYILLSEAHPRAIVSEKPISGRALNPTQEAR